MSAKLIKGTEIREEILEEISAEVARIKDAHGVVPGLVTILIGENPASVSYVTPEDQNSQSARISWKYRTISPIPFRRKNCWR